MATFDQVRKKIAELPEKIKRHAPNIIAETATEYFRDSFRRKAWEGVPWKPVKYEPGRGSLMVRSGELQATIRPSLVAENMVIISGGSPSVPYAEIHNTGGTITQTMTEKQRRFFWAREFAGKSASGGDGEVGMWGKTAMAKTLTIPIPQRQFMGNSPTLNKQILERLRLLVHEQ